MDDSNSSAKRRKREAHVRYPAAPSSGTRDTNFGSALGKLEFCCI